MKKNFGPYTVQVKEKVQKFLDKLDKKIKSRSIKAIEKLETVPIPRNKKHILATKGNALLCELSVDKIRFYYEIKHGIIYIEEAKFFGQVTVIEGKTNQKSGNKHFPNQQKFISKLLNWFKKKL